MRASAAARRSSVGAAVALGLHGTIGLALLSVDPADLLAKAPIVVELEIKDEPKPPPPDIKPEPPRSPEPTPEPRPRIVPRKLAAIVPPVVSKQEPPAPPPPNQEPPPTATKSAPPIFGVTMDSVVTGDSGMAVPVGNTLMTKDRTRAKPGQIPQPYHAEGTRPFVPIAEVYVADHPRVLHEEKNDEDYPPDARRLGIEGRVKLKVGIDETGRVVEVKVVEKAGHGFDEVATRAMWKFKFTPARTSDGKAVLHRLTYSYRFILPR